MIVGAHYQMLPGPDLGNDFLRAAKKIRIGGVPFGC